MADQKKPSTEDILAKLRKQDAGGAGAASGGDTAGGDTTPPAQPASDSPATGAPATGSPATGEEKPAAPKSTADILAAARAQGGGEAGQSAGKSASAAKPSSAPKSTADILAAARAQGKGAAGASSPPASKSGDAKKPAVKQQSAPVGDRPPLKEMVAAVKEAHQTGAPAKPKLPAGKASPVKPKLPKKAEAPSRRGFLAVLAAITITPFALAWTAFGGVTFLWSLGVARFMMPNFVLELPSQFKVGPPSDFPPGTVSEKYKASRGIWIVNTDEYDGRPMIYALASVCTHLGCTPNWLEGEQKFKCPCHGSGFYITGINFEGPAPRPLERVGIRVADDGSLEVDKSLKFQEELGQWSDGKSFVLS